MNAPAAYSIDKLTTFKARNGETWRVVYLDGNDPQYPVVALDSKGVPNTFTTDGQSITGKETEFDLVSPAITEPAPFRIDGPGEYRMRNGQKAVVTSVSHHSPWPFKGNCRYGDASWLENGSNSPSGENSTMDIVAKWDEPAPAPFVVDAMGQYRARNGEVWRVVYIADAGDRPVIALNDYGDPYAYQTNGKQYPSIEEPCDLIAKHVPIVRVERWLNIYADNKMGSFPRLSRTDADITAIAGRTGVVRVVHESGKLVSCEMEAI